MVRGLLLKRDTSIYPKDFVLETIQTLKLLFPKSDRQTKTWYRHQANLRPGGLDESLIKLGNLETLERKIEKFEYWHERLATLKEVFDDSESRPKSL
jgi:hypothetical protein